MCSFQTAVLQATCCAYALATNLHKWKALDDPITGKAYTLSLHIGVGVGAGDAPGQGGTLTAMHVGGVQDKWECVPIPSLPPSPAPPCTRLIACACAPGLSSRDPRWCK